MKQAKCDLNLIPKHRIGIWQPYRDNLVRMIDINGATVILNKIGSLIWQLIDGSRNLQEISALAIKNHQIHKFETNLTSDEIVDFIQYLNSKGWVSYGVDSTWNNTFFKDSDEENTGSYNQN